MNLFWFHEFDCLECRFYIRDLQSQPVIQSLWVHTFVIINECCINKRWQPSVGSVPLIASKKNLRKKLYQVAYRFRLATRLASKNLYFLYCSSNLFSTSSTVPLPGCFINWSTSSCGGPGGKEDTCRCAIFRKRCLCTCTGCRALLHLPQTLP